MLVFDCNGTLTSLSEVRKSHGFGLRPGIDLLRLLAAQSSRFSLAWWTSAVKSNLLKMRHKIEEAACIKFDCGLDRLHCVPAAADVLRKNKFETVKPLHEYFGEGPGPGLTKVILIDDNADKVLESEKDNLLLIPAWREERSDQVLSVLVKGLLSIDCTRDVRPQIKPIQDVVWQYYRRAHECRVSESTDAPQPPAFGGTTATTQRVFLDELPNEGDLVVDVPARALHTSISADASL
jgi:hypothetical protein